MVSWRNQSESTILRCLRATFKWVYAHTVPMLYWLTYRSPVHSSDPIFTGYPCGTCRPIESQVRTFCASDISKCHYLHFHPPESLFCPSQYSRPAMVLLVRSILIMRKLSLLAFLSGPCWDILCIDRIGVTGRRESWLFTCTLCI